MSARKKKAEDKGWIPDPNEGKAEKRSKIYMPGEPARKPKGFEFQKSNFGKYHNEQPTGAGFLSSNAYRDRMDKRQRWRDEKQKLRQKFEDTAKRGKRSMSVSKEKWDENWEKIFGKKKK